MARNFRAAFRHLVPGWLSEGDGGKVLHSLAIVKDMYMQRLRDGVQSRFPSRAGTSALRLLGEDRGIPRGRSETNAHYARRLIEWRYPKGHRVRGSALALLNQIFEYWGGLECWTIDSKGTSYTRYADSAGGGENKETGLAWNWNEQWAPGNPRWSRFWLGLDFYMHPEMGVTEHEEIGSDTLWGGTLAGADTTIGLNGITHEDVQAMRRLVRGKQPWKPAGTRAEYAIVLHGEDSVIPDGTWDDWRNRNPFLRYWYLRGGTV
jgi:hypothetical protein